MITRIKSLRKKHNPIPPTVTRPTSRLGRAPTVSKMTEAGAKTEPVMPMTRRLSMLPAACRSCGPRRS
jgi:hypothetical protein